MNSDGRSEMLRPFFLFFRARAQSPTSDKPKPNKLNRKERTLALAGTQVPGKVAKVQKIFFLRVLCVLCDPMSLLFAQPFHWEVLSH